MSKNFAHGVKLAQPTELRFLTLTLLMRPCRQCQQSQLMLIKFANVNTIRMQHTSCCQNYGYTVSHYIVWFACEYTFCMSLQIFYTLSTVILLDALTGNVLTDFLVSQCATRKFKFRFKCQPSIGAP